MRRVTVGLAGLAVSALWVVGRLQRRRTGREALRGKKVVVTGGSRGLGLALAREFAQSGAHLGLIARDGYELAAVSRELTAAGHRVATAVADLCDPAAVRGAIDELTLRLGAIDILVNNAGTISVGPFAHMSSEDLEQSLQLHLWAPFHAIHAVLPQMRARKAGRIVNVASIGGHVAIPHLLAYSVGKFALVGLSQGLAVELAREGIGVTTVSPGLMRTGSPRNAQVKGQHSREYAVFKLADSLPGASVSAEHAARVIVRACAEGASEVTIGGSALIARLVHGLFPSWTVGLLTQVNRLLPSPALGGDVSKTGAESESWLSRSPLAWLTHRAEERLGQRT